MIREEKIQFNIGDKVRCINNPNCENSKGSGWELGLVFEITDKTTSGDDRIILWSGKNGSGVYDDYLELV